MSRATAFEIGGQQGTSEVSSVFPILVLVVQDIVKIINGFCLKRGKKVLQAGLAAGNGLTSARHLLQNANHRKIFQYTGYRIMFGRLSIIHHSCIVRRSSCVQLDCALQETLAD
ncbi:hypothetical protein ElyMa_000193400 [Elysia marginata]|uniref:Uncharacterized protein n=1 Tax=Elysia marginata TaxID=1093978 RepID=A0AAV4EW47_9GAST|nr:hypothetical protein ElyMa_000193400 [Elysia marginata]